MTREEESEKNTPLVNKRERDADDDLQPPSKQMRELTPASSEGQDAKEEDVEENPDDFVLKRTERFLCTNPADVARFYVRFPFSGAQPPVAKNNKPDDTSVQQPSLTKSLNEPG